jgi:dihydrodipicolinate synthase/N-acetylneuraminate lyase
MPNGTSGESTSNNTEERMKILELWMNTPEVK